MNLELWITPAAGHNNFILELFEITAHVCLSKLGADVGFDSIGDFEVAKPLSKFLDRLDSENKLAKTILYNINPRDNELIGTMIGNFQDGSVPGKMQFGSGWWFLDQKDGMEKQINALSNLGLLSRFVGMLTDSRSFLSYTRHEYFRRTLCNLLVMMWKMEKFQMIWNFLEIWLRIFALTMQKTILIFNFDKLWQDFQE